MFAVGKTIGQADIDRKQAINKPGQFYSQSECIKNCGCLKKRIKNTSTWTKHSWHSKGSSDKVDLPSVCQSMCICSLEMPLDYEQINILMHQQQNEIKQQHCENFEPHLILRNLACFVLCEVSCVVWIRNASLRLETHHWSKLCE